MSGDPTPPDPDTLTADMPGGGEESAAADSSGGIGDHPVVEGLMSTEPKGSADTPAEMAIRGGKKFIRGALGARVKSGQTALEDFIHASIGFWQADGQQQQQQREPGSIEEELSRGRRVDGQQPQGDDAVDWNQADE